jgi:tRNA nucleotidyltransferase/poly(A) polymerase
MADYIYTMETRLTPEQLGGVSLVQDIARAQEMNVYLTGGTVRDLVSGLPIRDLDFTIQGNPLRLQRELERAGASLQAVDDDLKVLYLLLPNNVRAEITMARSETYEKPGKPPAVTPATITEDLRRRDFTINAMALSLNPGSRGLLLDPSNGAADIEAKLIRILHNYSFYEDPSRLIRATRFTARFHWPLEERTKLRYDAAKENNYIEYINQRAVGIEIEQLAYEEDSLHIMRALEKEDWLKILHPHWSVGKVDTAGLTQLTKLKQQMYEFGYMPDTAAVVLYFLTRRLTEKDVADIRKLIPRRDLVDDWKRLEDDSKELSKKLTGKEAATPSRSWQLLSEAKPEAILFTQITARQQAITQKIGNFFGKWRQIKQKLPLPEMVELRITPSLPDYPKISEAVFRLLLDGKLRSRTELSKFLKPYAPPPPPPPPAPAKRGKAGKTPAAAGAPTGRKAKKAAAAAATTPAPQADQVRTAAAPAPAAQSAAKKPEATKADAKKPAKKTSSAASTKPDKKKKKK